jgi:hypothetical protein
MLKCILDAKDVGYGLDLTGSGYGTMEGSFEDGNQNSACIKGEGFIDQLSDYQLTPRFVPCFLYRDINCCCSLESSTGDLSVEAAQLERAIRSNDTLRVKRFLDLHHDKFQVS